MKFVFVSLGVIVASALQAQPAPPASPNVIVIYTDDQHRDEFGYYGGHNATPTIDSLANNGLIFDHFYVPTALCAPSRIALQTGRYPSASPPVVRSNPPDRDTNGDDQPDPPYVLQTLGDEENRPAETFNLPYTLQQNGYVTGIVGKWHLGFLGARQRPAQNMSQLLHNFDLTQQAAYAAGYDYAEALYHDNIQPDNFADAYMAHNPEWVSWKAREFIDAQAGGGEPFFLVVNPTMPHWPPADGGPTSFNSLTADKAITGIGDRDDALSLPEGDPNRVEILAIGDESYDGQGKGLLSGMPARSTIQARADASGYDGTYAEDLVWLDDMVDALMDKVVENGIQSNTLVFVISDHGRGGKWSNRESGISSGALAYWPGTIPAGSVSSDLVANVDLAPTLFELAGVTPAPGADLHGISVAAHLLDPTGTASGRPYAYSEIGYERTITRADGMKLMVNHGVADLRTDELGADWTDPIVKLHDMQAEVDNKANVDRWQEGANLANDPAYATTLQEMKELLREQSLVLPHEFGLFTLIGPVITVPPESKNVLATQTVVFTVDVAAFYEYDIQWFVDGAPAGSGNSLTLTDVPLSLDGAQITVAATNSEGTADNFSNPAILTVDPVPTEAPAAPSALTASVQGVDAIDLSWTDNADNEFGFKVERRSGGGAFSEIATVDRDGTTYTDTELSSGTAYTYRVRAWNSAGDSGYSGEASASTPVYVPAMVLESFEYQPVGGNVDGTRDGGEGWAGPWEDISGPTVAEGLTYPGLLTTGNALYQPSNVQGRDFSTATHGIGGSDTLWASILFQADNYANGQRLRVMTASGGGSFAGWGFDINSNNTIAAIVQDGGTGSEAALAPEGEVNLAVMRMNLATSTLDLWINPSDFSSETALGSPSSSAATGTPDINFGSSVGVYFRAEVGQPITFDEFRLDTNFANAVASNASPGNRAPSADAGADQAVIDSDDNGSETVTLDGSGSSDTDGTIVSYVWEENSSQIATGGTPNVALAVGVHTITLTVTDDEGATDTDTVVITVDPDNFPPTADAGPDQTVTDSDDDGTETVTLDGSGSSDTDGPIVSYVWEENSTQIATGGTPNVALAVGVHTITLTVTDDEGATDTDTVVVTISPPSAGGSILVQAANLDFGTAIASAGGQPVTVTGDFTTLSAPDSVLLVAVGAEAINTVDTATFGGTPLIPIDGATFDEGAQEVYFFYLDLGDEVGETASLTVTGSPNFAAQGFAVAVVQVANADIGTLVAGEGNLNMADPDGGTLAGLPAGSFVFGQAVQNNNDSGLVTSGSFTPTASATAGGFNAAVIFAYETNASGDFEARYGTNDDGAFSHIAISPAAAPSNNPPTADAGTDRSVVDFDGDGSVEIALDGSGSVDTDGAIVGYVWEEASSQIATGAAPNVSVAVGSHSIDLIVTDDDGAMDTDSVVVTVSAKGDYAAWEAAHFTSAQQADPEFSDPDKSPWYDGVTNAEKFLYHIDPGAPMTDADRAALPRVRMEDNAGNPTIVLTFRQAAYVAESDIQFLTGTEVPPATPTTPTADAIIGTDPVTGDPIREVKFAGGAGRLFVTISITAG